MTLSSLRTHLDGLGTSLKAAFKDPFSRPVPLLLTAATGSLAGLLLWKTWRNRKRKYPPSPRGWPLFGNVLELSEDKAHEDFIRIQKKHNLPNIFTLYIGQRNPTIILNSYDMMKDALVTQGDLFADRPPSFAREASGMQDEIMFSSYLDPNWSESKTIIMSALRSTGFGSTASSQAKIEDQLDSLWSFLDPYIASGQPVNITEILPRLTTNIIFQITFNKTYALDDEELLAFMDQLRLWYDHVGKVWFMLELVPSWFSRIFLLGKVRDLHDCTQGLFDVIRREINEHIRTLDPENPRDFVDAYLCKRKDALNKEALTSTIYTFLPDSIETVASQVAWFLLYLAHYPAVEAKVRAQIAEVTGGSRLVAWSDRHDLPYVEAVMMEVMRVVVPVPATLRHTVTKETYFHGWFIDPGVSVIGNIYAAMRDHNHFKNPDTFNPDRFIDNDAKLIKSEAWIPFSLGRRRCLGDSLSKIEIFVLATNIVQRCNFRFPEGEPPPSLEAINHVVSRVPQPYQLIMEYCQ